MNSKLLVLAASALILTGCMMAPMPGGGMAIIPILPAVVEVDVDDHYAYDGYDYFYADDRWYYSDSRYGHRSELPRSHWPRETRRHGHGHSR